MNFVDFWKKGRGVSPKLLIFDSKFTTYRNLNKLNQSKEQIQFLTLRRRSKKLMQQIEQISDNEWQKVNIDRSKGKFQKMRVHDGTCELRQGLDYFEQ